MKEDEWRVAHALGKPMSHEYKRKDKAVEEQERFLGEILNSSNRFVGNIEKESIISEK